METIAGWLLEGLLPIMDVASVQQHMDVVMDFLSRAIVSGECFAPG